MSLPATCVRCPAPLQLPGRIHAAYHTTVDYCCADCARGETCVCQLVADPARGTAPLRLAPDDTPLIPITLSRTARRSA